MTDNILRGTFRAAAGLSHYCMEWCQRRLFDTYCGLFIDAPFLDHASVTKTINDLREKIPDHIGTLAIKGDLSRPGLSHLAQEGTMHAAALIENSGGPAYAWRMAATGIALVLIAEVLLYGSPQLFSLWNSVRPEVEHTLTQLIDGGGTAPTLHYM